MRVLVTGASGAIGTALLPHLDAAHLDVWTVDLRPLDRNQHLVVDLEDPGSVQSVGEMRPDAVVHLAGALGSDVDQLFRANVLGTVNLLSLLAQGTRVIVTGSAAEYGEGQGTPLAETDSLRPVNPYGWSKVAQTTIASAIAERRSLELTVVRPFNIVSADLPATTALGNMLRQVRGNGDASSAVIRTGRLDIVRDYVPLEFVAHVLSTLVHEPESTGTFNICSGVGIKLGDILGAMGKALSVEIVADPDPTLISLPAPSIVTGDPTRLADRFELTVRPTSKSIAALVLGLSQSGGENAIAGS